jgi:deoxyribodipyrimidine photo-lyase
MEVADKLEERGISFHLLKGSPGREVAGFGKGIGAGLIVADASPLRQARLWMSDLEGLSDVRIDVVDSHNIVPVTTASDKREYAAYTIRPKLKRLMREFLTPIPPLVLHPLPYKAAGRASAPIEMELRSLGAKEGAGSLPPGERAAMQRLVSFLDSGLSHYPASNDPNEGAQSGLSPYIHFGQISAQRAVSEALLRGGPGSEEFVEQAFIRRELAENFCHYCEEYDGIGSFPAWATGTLDKHRQDVRDYDYSYEELEESRTHDRLWNAAQRQMVRDGIMPGYLRMYWAKKVLEWSDSPESAMKKVLRLNDSFSLDGRDPNGYAGIAWSIGGVHDRPWGERPIFGMVRYMSYEGAKRKFDVEKYIESVQNG